MRSRTELLGAAVVAFASAGCATARFYDESGQELPGLPFVWKDAEGRSHLAYVRASTGLGSAAFSLKRQEGGGYTEFTNNLDSKGATQIASEILDQVFQAGVREGRAQQTAELRAQLEKRALRTEDPAVKKALLEAMDSLGP